MMWNRLRCASRRRGSRLPPARHQPPARRVGALYLVVARLGNGHFGYVGSMSYDWPTMAVKWRALSLKRLEHFDELKLAGRWRRLAHECRMHAAMAKRPEGRQRWLDAAKEYERQADQLEAVSGLAPRYNWKRLH